MSIDMPITHSLHPDKQPLTMDTDTGIVSGRIVAAQVTGATGLLLSFVALWPWMHHLAEFGSIGSKLFLLFLLAVPLCLVALFQLASYKEPISRFGKPRFWFITITAILGLMMTGLDAYVLFTALP